MSHERGATFVAKPTVEAIDLGLYRDDFAASHLIRWPGGCALVDVGSRRNLPALMAALNDRGLSVCDLTYVFLTHIHLDHAGGAGALLAEPGCRASVVVHQNGVRHMADPTLLEQGARAVYGDDEFDRVYGALLPIPRERMLIVRGGEKLRDFDPDSNLDAHFMDTPGHARHHYCLHLPALGAVFTGDTFGISYPVMRLPAPVDSLRAGVYLFPTTTPTAFDPEALKASVRSIGDLKPEVCFLTHFGALYQPTLHVEHLCSRIDALVAEAVAVGEMELPRHSITETLACRLEAWTLHDLRSCGFTDRHAQSIIEALRFDIALNSQGLVHWLYHHGPMSEVRK